MIEIASLAAGASVAAAVLALASPSRVALRLARFEARAAGARRLFDRVPGFGWRLVAGALAGLAGLAIAPILAFALGYAVWVAPSLIADRRQARARAAAAVATTTLVERLEALVSAGRPVESALVRLAELRSGSSSLDRALGEAARLYVLGAPLLRAIASQARADGLPALVRLAEELDRSRDLGTGSLAAIHDAREELRAAERTRALDAAARIDAKLVLVVVLCYMPALMLVVVIPLFLGLLGGLFGP